MEHEFDKTPIPKLVLRLGIPAMCAQFFNILYSIVDRAFAGHIAADGEIALASIGLCAPVLTAITAFSTLVGIGGASVMSISIGKKDYKNARLAMNNAAVLCGTGMNQFILAFGNAKRGMFAVMIGAIVNTILDPIFIYVFHMGIHGAAAATAIAQFCVLLYVLFFLFSDQPAFRLSYSPLDYPFPAPLSYRALWY